MLTTSYAAGQLGGELGEQARGRRGRPSRRRSASIDAVGQVERRRSGCRASDPGDEAEVPVPAADVEPALAVRRGRRRIVDPPAYESTAVGAEHELDAPPRRRRRRSRGSRSRGPSSDSRGFWNTWPQPPHSSSANSPGLPCSMSPVRTRRAGRAQRRPGRPPGAARTGRRSPRPAFVVRARAAGRPPRTRRRRRRRAQAGHALDRGRRQPDRGRAGRSRRRNGVPTVAMSGWAQKAAAPASPHGRRHRRARPAPRPTPPAACRMNGEPMA